MEDAYLRGPDVTYKRVPRGAKLAEKRGVGVAVNWKYWPAEHRLPAFGCARDDQLQLPIRRPQVAQQPSTFSSTTATLQSALGNSSTCSASVPKCSLPPLRPETPGRYSRTCTAAGIALSWQMPTPALVVDVISLPSLSKSKPHPPGHESMQGHFVIHQTHPQLFGSLLS
ncbi:hypothetical protein PtA15_12A174 [Puccinia triticina]|uniref:Uncharacterized protein n=1 Tax=Puccinia triticina TaxID=208348 RepID=A0ABY7CY10_9BASI|nr:uncharacterized protein PtA15_12A174 [Puccinia triticina]WAQ90188.1 hypothetical protein PtA15_12A174 [Puccinia triticina]WAR61479.1 hypothetical protein PtB15_12B164 [Puccinia triticina]